MENFNKKLMANILFIGSIIFVIVIRGNLYMDSKKIKNYKIKEQRQLLLKVFNLEWKKLDL